jgi:hypothetical protein
MKLITNNLNRKKINSVIKIIEKYCADSNETFYMEGFSQADKEDPTFVNIKLTLNTAETHIPQKLRNLLERKSVYLSYRLCYGTEPLVDPQPVYARLEDVAAQNGQVATPFGHVRGRPQDIVIPPAPVGFVGERMVGNVQLAAPMNDRQREIVEANRAMFRENEANGRANRPIRLANFQWEEPLLVVNPRGRVANNP